MTIAKGNMVRHRQETSRYHKKELHQQPAPTYHASNPNSMFAHKPQQAKASSKHKHSHTCTIL